jgi:Domain of unknown function (DUF397)
VRSSDFPHASWRKSSRSNGGGDGNCVEVAELPGRVVIRDSKDPAGPVLMFAGTKWQSFVSSVQSSALLRSETGLRER